MCDPDVIVVGQGLAGTLLTRALRARGLRTLVIDAGSGDTASRAAAGMLTPVTGKRLSATADAERDVPYALATYTALAGEIGATVLYPGDVFRAFVDEEEIALHARRAADPKHARWFGPALAPEATPAGIAAPLGGFFITGGARVDLPALLDAARALFANDPTGRVALRAEHFDHAKLVTGPDGVRYGDVTARALVFSEGARVTENPWFAGPVWQPAKGEFITCRFEPDPMPGVALKIGLTATALPDGARMIGAHYDWDDRTLTPTLSEREKLLASAAAMLAQPPDNLVVLDHRAGIRPAARGAKPVVGAHHSEPHLYVLNGFGAKGCTWAPWHADRLADRLAEAYPVS